MKYEFFAEVKANDQTIKIIFNSNNARDLLSAWHGVYRVLYELRSVGEIQGFTMEATEVTAKAWMKGGHI